MAQRNMSRVADLARQIMKDATEARIVAGAEAQESLTQMNDAAADIWEIAIRADARTGKNDPSSRRRKPAAKPAGQ